MRMVSTLLCSAFLLGVSATARAQYQVGPIYPENPRSQYGSSAPSPFRLNWSTGRFDYIPVPYSLQPSGSYDPYRFNTFTGRWDYVPLTLGQSPSPQQQVVGVNPVAPMSPPSAQTAPPQVSPDNVVPNQTVPNETWTPGIVNYYYSPVRGSAPRATPPTEPAKPPSGEGIDRSVASPSVAPTTRPAATPGSMAGR
jgi:hypothetical protein